MKTYGQTSKGVISEYFVIASAKVHFREKGGDFKNMLRNTRKKRLLRISMKRITRQKRKKELRETLMQTYSFQ